MTRELLETLRKTIAAGRRVLTPPRTQPAASPAEPAARAPAPPLERSQEAAHLPGGRETEGG